MKRILPAALLLAAASSGGATAWAEPRLQWLCEAEMSTGFVFEEGAWRPRHFEAAEKAWVFTAHEVLDFSDSNYESAKPPLQQQGRNAPPATPEAARKELPTKLVYSLSKPGADWPILQCNAREVFDVIQCEVGETAFASKRLFRFNPFNNRFMLVAPNGYVETPDESAPASEITIGSCKLL